MNSILFLSVGKHGQMLNLIRETLNLQNLRLLTASNSRFASGLYSGNENILLSDINDNDYIDSLLNVCEKYNVKGIFTLLDEETLLLSQNKTKFEKKGIKIFTSSYQTNRLCFNKYDFHKELEANGIPTIATYKKLNTDFNYPIVIKPNSGKGSVGVKIIENEKQLKQYYYDDMIIQDYIVGNEYDVDAYVDIITGEVADIYIKEKLVLGLGGASVTRTVYDPEIKELIIKTVKRLELYGPLNFDIIHDGNKYLLMEVNARFGAGYVHTHLAGHDFIELIINNLKGIENKIKRYTQEKSRTFIKDNSYIVVD